MKSTDYEALWNELRRRLETEYTDVGHSVLYTRNEIGEEITDLMAEIATDQATK